MNMIVSSQILRIKISLTALFCSTHSDLHCLVKVGSIAQFVSAWRLYSANNWWLQLLQDHYVFDPPKLPNSNIMQDCTNTVKGGPRSRYIYGSNGYYSKAYEAGYEVDACPNPEGRAAGPLHIFNMAAVAKLIRSVLSETLLASSLFRMLVSLENSQTQPY